MSDDFEDGERIEALNKTLKEIISSLADNLPPSYRLKQDKKRGYHTYDIQTVTREGVIIEWVLSMQSKYYVNFFNSNEGDSSEIEYDDDLVKNIKSHLYRDVAMLRSVSILKDKLEVMSDKQVEDFADRFREFIGKIVQ